MLWVTKHRGFQRALLAEVDQGQPVNGQQKVGRALAGR